MLEEAIIEAVLNYTFLERLNPPADNRQWRIAATKSPFLCKMKERLVAARRVAN